MKETLHASVGSQAFIFDEDAYGTLRSYLDEIRARLPEGDAETMQDIEERMAELLRERIGGDGMRVVTLALVHEAMLRMGPPSEFGERRSDDDPHSAPSGRRFRRSRTDCAIAGICGGAAEFFGISSTFIRIVALLLLLSGGLTFWIYIILWIAVPKE